MSHDLMSKAVSIYIIHNTFHESSRFFFYIVNIIIVALLNYNVFIFINLQRSCIKNGLIQMSKKNDNSYIPNNTNCTTFVHFKTNNICGLSSENK